MHYVPGAYLLAYVLMQFGGCYHVVVCCFAIHTITSSSSLSCVLYGASFMHIILSHQSITVLIAVSQSAMSVQLSSRYTVDIQLMQ